MPIAALWSLVICLVGLALGTTYKWVENAHALKLADKESDRLRTVLAALEETRKNESLCLSTEIDTLTETHNKEISDIEELHHREANELRKEIEGLIHISTPVEENKVLPKEQIEILIILYKQDNLQTEYVAQVTGSLPQTARFHLEELKSYNMVSYHMHRPSHNRNAVINVWSIIQGGRKYLHEHEMKA